MGLAFGSSARSSLSVPGMRPSGALVLHLRLSGRFGRRLRSDGTVLHSRLVLLDGENFFPGIGQPPAHIITEEIAFSRSTYREVKGVITKLLESLYINQDHRDIVSTSQLAGLQAAPTQGERPKFSTNFATY